MRSRFISGAALVLTGLIAALPTTAQNTGQNVQPICHPTLSAPIDVATPAQRNAAGLKALPPIGNYGFSWPDAQLSALRGEDGQLYFFSIDASIHPRHPWHGQEVGNNNSGSVVRTIGTLDNPLGSEPPVDVVINANPDPKVNPHNCDPFKDPHNYCYTYIGGGPVYQVPKGQAGAGSWLLVYHAEYNDPAYFMLGLAISTDKGWHWTDIGEIIRVNQPFSYSGQGMPFAIGDPPLTISPDGKYFYVYFQDLMKTGKTTNISVARAPIAEVIQDAFGSSVHFAAAFQKYYQGAWDQPGIGGLSSDLGPQWPYGGGLTAAYDSYLQRYLMFNADSQNYSYAESPDGLHWSDNMYLGTLGVNPNGAGYSAGIGTGDDPNILGQQFYVYYTQFRGPWPTSQSVKRFTMTCQ
jgi:hypothetical protein